MKSASRAIIQFAGTEGNDCVGLASGKGFREGRCKKSSCEVDFHDVFSFQCFYIVARIRDLSLRVERHVANALKS